MKIAIACSGLGHVQRGIESWAFSIAQALAKRNVDVTLFAGSAVSSGFAVSGQPAVRRISCFCRGRRTGRVLAALFNRLGGWRYGFGSDYQVEQTSMAPGLIMDLRKNGFEIVHLQDPWLGFLLEKAWQKGWHGARVILAHGTEESAEFLRCFRFVQHLAPWHKHEADNTGPGSYCIPNFVNTTAFCPVAAATRIDSRRRLGVPDDAFVIGSIAAIKKSHKRLDYLIREFSTYLRNTCQANQKLKPFLLVAGAATPETPAIRELAAGIEGGRCLLIENLPYAAMPDVYRAMDVFVLTSLFEMMPVAVIEAMASGVPVVVNNHPVLRWIAGNGGACVEMKEEGNVSSFLRGIKPDWLGCCGRQARQRAEDLFSEDVVVDEILKMYAGVLQ